MRPQYAAQRRRHRSGLATNGAGAGSVAGFERGTGHVQTRDGDGMPNRYDRVYNPRWDRDGDGVPNRYDRHDHTRYGRDGRGSR